MDLDQQDVSLSYRQPINGDWVDDETDIVASLMFSDDIPVPTSPNEFSPFMATVWNFEDRDEYYRTETLRRQFARVRRRPCLDGYISRQH